MENAVELKSFQFAVRIVKLCKHLRGTKKEYTLSKQLLRSGTSIGANIHEANYASSRADFIAKMQVLGCDINPTSYSKLEGQVRSATDKEIYVIAKILNVTMEELFGIDEVKVE